MLEAYHKLHPKPKWITELKEVLQLAGDLAQEQINKAVKSALQLQRCAKAGGEQFERRKWLSNIKVFIVNGVIASSSCLSANSLQKIEDILIQNP